MAKTVKKIVKKSIKVLGKVDPLRGGDVVLEGLGLPNLLGEKTGALTTGSGFAGLLGGITGANAAGASSQALADALKKQAAEASRQNADLSLENVATVQSGSSSAARQRRARRTATSGSSSLGINVG